MSEQTTTVTKKGQVTIPVEIRKALGLKQGDHVAFVLGKDNQVHLRRSESVVERTAGALRGWEAALTAEQLREATDQAVVDDVVARMEG